MKIGNISLGLGKLWGTGLWWVSPLAGIWLVNRSPFIEIALLALFPLWLMENMWNGSFALVINLPIKAKDIVKVKYYQLLTSILIAFVVGCGAFILTNELQFNVVIFKVAVIIFGAMLEMMLLTTRSYERTEDGMTFICFCLVTLLEVTLYYCFVDYVSLGFSFILLALSLGMIPYYYKTSIKKVF